MITSNEDIQNYIASIAAESFPEFSPTENKSIKSSICIPPAITTVEPICTNTSWQDCVFIDEIITNKALEIPEIVVSAVEPPTPKEAAKTFEEKGRAIIDGIISPSVLSNVSNKAFNGADQEYFSHGTDMAYVRKDFPILAEKFNGKPLIWFDNAATTQKPQQVIDRISYFYAHENSNIHRAAHTLAQKATDAYEDARKKTAAFLNAPSPDNIIFVRGTTEGINLIANSYGKKYIGKDDEIIISILEHHANIVPWQLLCQETGAKLRIIPVNESGEIILSEYEKLFNSNTKFVSVAYVSNALGTITPVSQLIDIAHRHGVKILIDGAQSVSHIPTDVQGLDCDFFVFSGHKIYGPTGIGVVYGKKDILEEMPPYQGGGNMIQDVTFERTIYQGVPDKFEAGTGNIAGAVGLGAALEYVQKIGMTSINKYEHYLLEYGTEALKKVPGLRIIGNAASRTSILSFFIVGYEAEKIGKALKAEEIAVRAGHHCAQPILRRFNLEAAVRSSLAFYNTTEELDMMAEVLKNFVKK